MHATNTMPLVCVRILTVCHFKLYLTTEGATTGPVPLAKPDPNQCTGLPPF